MNPRDSDLERRIVVLEAQGRPWRMFGIACLVTSLVWTCHPNATPDAVRARSFTLVDADDRAYAELKMTDDGPGLFLLDAKGVARVSLVHNSEETALYVRDSSDQFVLA